MNSNISSILIRRSKRIRVDLSWSDNSRLTNVLENNFSSLDLKTTGKISQWRDSRSEISDKWEFRSRLTFIYLSTSKRSLLAFNYLFCLTFSPCDSNIFKISCRDFKWLINWEVVRFRCFHHKQPRFDTCFLFLR